jgi:hypothetical protein
LNEKIFASALACFFCSLEQSFAQLAPDIFSGNPDVLYAMASRRFSPFAQFIFGGRKVTQEIDNLTLKKQLLNAWNDGNGTLGHYPKQSDYSVETAQNGPGIAVGGGFDWVVTRPLPGAFSPSKYTHSWMNNVGPIHPQGKV